MRPALAGSSATAPARVEEGLEDDERGEHDRGSLIPSAHGQFTPIVRNCQAAPSKRSVQAFCLLAGMTVVEATITV